MLRKKWFFWGAGAVAAVLLTLAIVVPLLVKRQASDWVATHTRRTLHIEAVSLNPLTLTLTVAGVHLSDPDGGPELLAFERLRVALSLRSVIDRALILRRIELTNPRLHLVRTGPNRYSIDDLLALGGSTPAAPPAPADAEPLRFSLNNIQLSGGSIEFVDQGVAPAQTHTVSDLLVSVPFVGNVPYQTDLFVTPELRATVNGTEFLFAGKLKPFRDGSETLLEINLVGLDLAHYAPYFPGELPVQLQRGTLDTSLNVSYRTSSASGPEVVLSGEAALNDLILDLPDGAPLFRIKALHASFAPSTPLTGHIAFRSLSFDAPQFDVHRDRQGRWRLPFLAAAATRELSRPEPLPTTAAQADGPVPHLVVEQLRLTGGTVRLRDELPRPAFATTLSDIACDVAHFDSGAATPAAWSLALKSSLGEALRIDGRAGLKPLQAEARLSLQQVQLRNYHPYLQQWLVEPVRGVFALEARFAYDEVAGARLGETTLSWRLGPQGRLTLTAAGRPEPLQLDGTLRLQRFPLSDFIAYLPANYHLVLADGSASGQLRYRLNASGAGLGGSVAGSLAVHNLYALDSIEGNDLVRWESLQLDDLRANLRPLEVAIGAISLSGADIRIIIDRQGQLNFGNAVSQEAETPDAAAEEPPVDVAASPPAKITVGAVTLQNGRIDFTDQQLSPPFHAEMTELGGRVSGLSSAADQRADLDLRGTLAGRSPLRIAGQLNPLTENPFAEIRINFDDIELAPVTPYSGRYAGYTIAQGKLFLDLRYHLEDHRIDSSNRIFIDQFDFGDQVESPDATTLPVRLAVALLKDRNGEIHLDIPVTGRSDDPEFRIGQVLWMILKNLIVKAATSPMALLSSMMGGEEFSAVAFPPGLSRLEAAEAAKLAGLGKLLLDRPALKLTVSGHADAERDPENYRREQLRLKVARARYLSLVKSGTLPAGATPESLAVPPEEYAKWLKEAYGKEKFPKPRNFLGIAKELPEDEMEKLILANVVVGANELDQLAWERGAVVVRALIEQGGLPQERIFQKRPEKPVTTDGGNRVEFGLTSD